MNSIPLIMPCIKCIRDGKDLSALYEQLHTECKTQWKIDVNGEVKCSSEECKIGTLHLQDIPITCGGHNDEISLLNTLSEAKLCLQLMSELKGKPGIPTNLDDCLSQILPKVGEKWDKK